MPHQTTHSNSIAYTSDTTMSLISFRCKPTISSLPPELLSRIAFNLALHEYSYLSRTCSSFHQHLFHPSEMVHFLKTRYKLSFKSGSMIIFAYLANMQVRAPLLLERIFEDFFADSPVQIQQENLRQSQLLNHCRHQEQQLQQLQHHHSNSNECNHNIKNNSTAIQTMNYVQAQKDAEKARREAKWDAVRMLGVLYALDKTHVGVSIYKKKPFDYLYFFSLHFIFSPAP